MIESAEFDWNEARLSCYGRDDQLFVSGACTSDLHPMHRPRFRMNFLAALTWQLLLVLAPAVEGQITAMVTLDQAIDLSLAHNHSLKATRTQNQAQKITANLRPTRPLISTPSFGQNPENAGDFCVGCRSRGI